MLTKSTQPKHNYSSSAATNSKFKTDRSQQITSGTTSSKKIIRDLREDFDDYVLREQQHQYSDHTEEQGDHNQSNKSEVKMQSCLRKQKQKTPSYHHQTGFTKSKQRLKTVDSKPRESKQSSNKTPIPKSYLLAMQHLQDLVQNKNQQILGLKQQLLQKQQALLESQSRINQVLVKYHQLIDLYARKQTEVDILKQQMDQLRVDKRVALKQAAKVLENQFKNTNSAVNVNKYEQKNQSPWRREKFVVQEHQSIGYRKRAVSSNHGATNKQIWTANMRNQQNFIKKQEIPNIQINQQKYEKYPEPTIYQPLVSGQLPKQSNSHRSPALMNLLQTPLLTSKTTPLSSNLGQNRDFISYQRQVIRNQKQLIALKYRMECMQRKLSTNPKEQGVKYKIRKLSEQIDNKQKIINDLKNI